MTVFPTTKIPNIIAGCQIWFDATDPNGDGTQPADSTLISNWVDKSGNKRNATQSSSGLQPAYKLNSIVGKPCLQFTGGQYILYDGTFFANTDYTVFAVDQRQSTANSNFFMAGTTQAENENLLLGYSTNTSVIFGQYANDINYAIPGYDPANQIIRLHTCTLNSSAGRVAYLDGVVKGTEADPTPLSSYINASIGTDLNSYTGNLAEVIAYNRTLTMSEQQLIEQYLANKWGIALS